MSRRSVLRGLTVAALLGALVALPALAGDRDDARRSRNRDRDRSGDSYYNYDRGSRADFGLSRNPHWQKVRGTRVMVIRDEERPDYDMFRYGREYYVYANGRWYRSTNWRGAFRPIDENRLPNDFRMVPREYWSSYPSGWNDNNRWRNDRNRNWDRDRDRDRDDDRYRR